MKRKTFLRRMRDHRRGDRELELRDSEQRRRVDWRTLRVELPDDGEVEQQVAVGVVLLRPENVELRASESCWVRGYRRWENNEGEGRAEFQYRLAQNGNEPPPGSTSVEADGAWIAEGDRE